MKKGTLLQWSFSFLKWICPDHLYEEIEGDLIQKFNRDVKNVGEKRAKRKLVWNVVRFCRPGIIFRNKFSWNLIQSTTLTNSAELKNKKSIVDLFDALKNEFVGLDYTYFKKCAEEINSIK